jgi:hypothetical protein
MQTGTMAIRRSHDSNRHARLYRFGLTAARAEVRMRDRLSHGAQTSTECAMGHNHSSSMHRMGDVRSKCLLRLHLRLLLPPPMLLLVISA